MLIKNNKTGKEKDVRLPKAFKAKWLKALRSGEFKQTTDYLFNKEDNGYCCLGVACKIAHPKLKIDNLNLINKDTFKEKLAALKIPALLKGDTDDDAEDYNPVVEKLTTMNDSGKTFKQIAVWVEKNL